MNWVTLVMEKDPKDDKLDKTIDYIQALILSSLNHASTNKVYKRVRSFLNFYIRIVLMLLEWRPHSDLVKRSCLPKVIVARRSN